MRARSTPPCQPENGSILPTSAPSRFLVLHRQRSMLCRGTGESVSMSFCSSKNLKSYCQGNHYAFKAVSDLTRATNIHVGKLNLLYLFLTRQRMTQRASWMDRSASSITSLLDPRTTMLTVFPGLAQPVICRKNTNQHHESVS